MRGKIHQYAGQDHVKRGRRKYENAPHKLCYGGTVRMLLPHEIEQMQQHIQHLIDRTKPAAPKQRRAVV